MTVVKDETGHGSQGSLGGGSTHHVEDTGPVHAIARLVAEALTILGCLAFIVVQQGGEILSQGIRGSIRNLVKNILILIVEWQSLIVFHNKSNRQS